MLRMSFSIDGEKLKEPTSECAKRFPQKVMVLFITLYSFPDRCINSSSSSTRRICGGRLLTRMPTTT